MKADIEGMPVRERVVSFAHSGYPFLVAVLLACAAPYAPLVFQNQNAYLIHSVGARSEVLRADPIMAAADWNPWFTWLVDGAYSLAGGTGVRLLAAVAVFCALVAVYVFARALTPDRSRSVAVVAMAIVGLSVPVALELHAGFVTAFQGFAEQYLLADPVYAQPSIVGCVMLLAFAGWFTLLRNPDRPYARWVFVGALAAASFAGMVHPTYWIALMVAVGGAMLVDASMAGVRFRRFRWYAVVAVVVTVVTVAANPVLVRLSSTSESSEALYRFAFERIPHHTLLSVWGVRSVAWIVVLVAVSALCARTLSYGSWLSRWFVVVTAVGLGAAVVVQQTHFVALALTFPWRVSVLVVPLGVTVLAVRGALLVRRFRFPHWKVVFTGVLVACAVAGLVKTMSLAAPSEFDRATRAVLAARPTGVGVIPLKESYVRLNANVPVYVDWVASPYAGTDLVAWWARYDQVAAYEKDPELFCTGEWAAGVSWLLLGPSSVGVPSCVQGWTELVFLDGYRVLQRPGV